MSTKCLVKSKRKIVDFHPSYRCRVCKKSFRSFIIFEGHFAFNTECRAKNGWFIQCYVCGQKFRYFAELKYHLRRHAIQKTATKQTGSKTIDQKMEKENREWKSGYQCNVCQRNFRTSFHLKQHTKSHSKKAIAEKSRLNGDTIENGDPVSPSLQCKIYKTDCSNESELAQHTATHAQGRLKCEQCQLSFTTQISLTFHQKLFHRSIDAANETMKNNQSQLQCDICKAKFSFSGNLISHKLVHTNGDVECELCHIRFTKKSLEVHQKEAHPELTMEATALEDEKDSMEATALEDEKDSVEDTQLQEERETAKTTELQDEKESTEVIELEDGKQSTGGTVPEDVLLEEIQDDETAPKITYQCDKCDKSCASVGHLRQHLRSHRQYSCKICDKTFKTVSGMKSHSRRYIFECYVCNEDDFPTTKHLANHIRRHIVCEKWVDPVNVYLSNWNPEQSLEILQNQPLVLVENLNIKNMDLNFTVNVPKTSVSVNQEVNVCDDPPLADYIKVENGTDASSVVNGDSKTSSEPIDQLDSCRFPIELKYSEQIDQQTTAGKDETEQRMPSNGITDLAAISSDSEETLIVEQAPDTTTTYMDDTEGVIDISSESDVDDVLELFHCYFCNETFRSLHTLGVHVKKCSYCP